MTASDQLKLAAGANNVLTTAQRFEAIKEYLPADPLTLRLNTAISCWPGAMVASNAVGAGKDNKGAWSILCNICSGIGVYSAVINARPPEPAWDLTPECIGVKMNLGNYVVNGKNVSYDSYPITTYNGANRVMQWGQYGQLYDRYRVDYLIFEYVPSCGRMTDGQVTMLWNDNPTDRIPSTMGQFLTNTKCVTTQVYNRARLVVKPRRWLWTQPQAGNTGVRSKNIVTQNEVTAPYPDRTVDCGWFAVCARGASQNMGVAGTIRLTYSVRFAKPSMNLEYVKITQQEGGNVIVEPRGEMVQPAMPAAQRTYPDGLVSAYTQPVIPPQPPPAPGDNARTVEMCDYDAVPYDEPDDALYADGQAGSLVVGGGGNSTTTNDRWGSNYIGNPLYYLSECMSSGAGGKPDVPDVPDIPPIPGPPDNPDNPDTPVDPDDGPTPGPMLVASKAANVGFYVTNPSSREYPPYQSFTFKTSKQTSFIEVDMDYSIIDSGNKSMTPCSVVGLMTMSSDGDYSNSAGSVFCFMGPNLSYVKFTGNPADCEVTLPKASLVLAPTVKQVLIANVGGTTAYVQYPSQFWYAQGVYSNVIFHDSLTVGTRSCNVGHDFMIVFTGDGLHHYGVTYVPSMPGEVYGVYHPMNSEVYPMHSLKQPDVDRQSGSYHAAFSYANVPIGVSSDSPVPGSKQVLWFNVPRKAKFGVRVAITLSLARVSLTCQCIASLYAAVGQAVSNSSGSISLPPSLPYPHFNALFGFDGHIVTWPTTSQVHMYTDNGVGYIGAAYKVGEYGFYMDSFNTFGGNNDPLDTLVVFDSPTVPGASVGSGPYDGNGTSFVINGTFTPDAQFTATKLGIVAGLSITLGLNDSVDLHEWRGYPDYYCAQAASNGTWNISSGYGAAGAVFVVKHANLVYYDATNVPDGAPVHLLEAYLQANPQSVLLSM